MHVAEGPLVETPTADAGGMDRRAFGEFEGPRGELASYAIGWTTGTDERAGRLTVGIGAGNPGGVTIHAAIGVHEGGYAFGLVDEPFESVPEAGRDITAAEAREVEDLPFINDADDDLWQLIGPTDAGEGAKIGHLWHAIDEDPTLIDVLDLEPGERAVRERPGGAWTRRPETPGA